MDENIVLEMKHISKRFGGVIALNGVDFRVKKGQVHALMGENGAGKSTLMKILAGIHKPDEGEIILRGAPVNFKSPREAMENGISMIHQELSPILEMTVAENIYLGREKVGQMRIIDFKEMKKNAALLLKQIGSDVAPSQKIRSLSVSQTQMVEIAKAISFEADIIIMDEPSSTITTKEVTKLFEIINRLKAQGRCIIYITHKMDEVFEIADEITVFRDGRYIGTYLKDEIDGNQLIKLMVDRDLSEIYPKRDKATGEVVLRVENLCRKGKFKNISFELHKGEILGLAGLIGAGRTEVCESIFGCVPPDSGRVYVKDKLITNYDPSAFINLGMGYVTEDRKGSGLIMGMSVKDNSLLASLKRLSRMFVIDGKRAASSSKEYIEKLKIKSADVSLDVSSLSGGNQQKVVLAKWLMMQPDIIIFDEPTRGIDIGAKSEIYKLISDLAKNGAAILFISSEMPEILGMCDRIIVMYEGAVSGEVSEEEATSEKLLKYATGIET